MTICTWSVTELKTYSDEKNRDIVQVVNWKITAKDGTTEASTTGSTSLPAPEIGYVDYNDLTEEQVISWVKGALGEAQMNAAEGVAIAAVAAETYEPKPLPWAKPKQITDETTAVPITDETTAVPTV